MDMRNAYYDCRWAWWVINALLTDNGFVLPTRVHGVLCPGFLTNIIVGAFSAFRLLGFLRIWRFD